jgi:hypothetical protein
MNWIKDPKYIKTYYTTEKFNGYQYNVLVIVEETDKSIKYWIHASSGKKRKEFEIFEDKENKSLGGIRALFFIKEAMFDFPRYFKERRYVGNKTCYLCVGWAENRRRKIYQRIDKEGFQYMIEDGRKILMKKL